jgi:hypothetical protein
MSTKRILLTTVLCMGLIFGFFQGGSAHTGNTCFIFALAGSERTFSNADCDNYTTGYGWVALSPGLVNAYIKATSNTAYFTGGNVTLALSASQAHNLWGPIQVQGDDLIGAHCPTGKVYQSQFRWNLGQLAPGTYTLHFVSTLRYPVVDGTQSCVDDDGQHFPLVIYSGTLADNIQTVTITP